MILTDSFSPASGFASRTIFLRVPRRYSRCCFLNCGNPGSLGSRKNLGSPENLGSRKNLGSPENLRSLWTDMGL
jgi:hypothetical protein